MLANAKQNATALLFKTATLFNASVKNKILMCGGSIFTVSVLRYLYCKIDRKFKQLPDGPYGVPIFASLFSFLSDPLKFYDDRFTKDGELSCFYFGSFGAAPIIMVNSANAANIILRNAYCSGRNHFVEPVNMGFEFPARFAFIDNTDDCKFRRKIFKQQLIAHLNTSYFENQVQHTMHSILFKSLDGKIEKNELFYPRTEIFHATFLTIFQNVFGNKLNIDIKNDKYIRFDQLLQKYAQIGSFMTIIGMKVNYNFFVLKILDKLFNYSSTANILFDIYNYWISKSIGFKFDLINNKMVAVSTEDKQKLLNMDKNEPYTYCQALIKQYYDGNIDARTIYTDINMAFMAGIETTGNTMDFTLCTLAKYPNVQQQIYEELDKINDGDGNRYISIKNLSECHKLRMFIHECLRLSCIVSTSVPRKVMQTIKYKDYILPKGAEIFVNMRACNVYCNEWGVDGKELNLQHWADINGKFKYNKHLMSFGVGIRECTGKAVALKSLLYYTAYIILNYKIQGPNGDNNFDIVQSHHIVKIMDPQIGLKISERE